MSEQATVKISIGLLNKLNEYFLQRPTPEQQTYLFTVIAQELQHKRRAQGRRALHKEMLKEKDPERKKLLKGMSDDLKRLNEEDGI